MTKFLNLAFALEPTLSRSFSITFTTKKTICEKIIIQKDMFPLTEIEKAKFDSALTCKNCHNAFDRNSRGKVRHHQHRSGRFQGAVIGMRQL